jgi:hypothetical protein
MVEILREDLYALPFALFANVANAIVDDFPGLRVADIVAADTTRGVPLAYHALEIKRFRSDLVRELDNPSKAEETARHCETYTLVIPGSAKTFLGSRLMLPSWWGLIEIEGGRAHRVTHPTPLCPAPAPEGFLQALLRSAVRTAEREQLGAEGAPLRRIVGRLARDLVLLGPCLHKATRPLTKPAPTSIPCFACASGDPADADAVQSVLEQAEPAELERYEGVIAARLRRLGRPGLASVQPAPELASAGGGAA